MSLLPPPDEEEQFRTDRRFGSAQFGKGYAERYDAFIVPFNDISLGAGTVNPFKSAVSSFGLTGAAGMLGAIGLTGIMQLEVDKGNVITAHRVDGGYALTQRGGKHDDRVFIRLLLTGPARFFYREILSFYADNKAIPLAFLSREVRLAKCQIESLKVIANSERRQALIVHVIFRQLRTFQDNIYSTGVTVALSALAGAAFMGEENIYDNAQAPGASFLSFDIFSHIDNVSPNTSTGD